MYSAQYKKLTSPFLTSAPLAATISVMMPVIRATGSVFAAASAYPANMASRESSSEWTVAIVAFGGGGLLRESGTYTAEQDAKTSE